DRDSDLRLRGMDGAGVATIIYAGMGVSRPPAATKRDPPTDMAGFPDRCCQTLPSHVYFAVDQARKSSIGPPSAQRIKVCTMFPPPLVKLEDVTNRLRDTQKRGEVLWQEPESLAFVARGREYRSEFHVNDSDEFTYMIKGTMNLHYRTK